MKEEERRLENLPGPLLDLDVTPDGAWVGVTGNEKQQVLLFGGQPVRMPRACHFPNCMPLS
jgi:hypothetical protein